VALLARKLISFASFDQWLLGNKDAITENELADYNLFKDSGCVACHNGPVVG